MENGIKYNVDDGWVRVSLDADHKYFYITVADSCMGIPEDSIESCLLYTSMQIEKGEKLGISDILLSGYHGENKYTYIIICNPCLKFTLSRVSSMIISSSYHSIEYKVCLLYTSRCV